jgi:hypothetical protein
VARLYPQALGSKLTLFRNRSWSSLYSLIMDRIEDTSSSSCIVALQSVAWQRACLLSCSIATAVYAGFTVLPLSKYADMCTMLLVKDGEKGGLVPRLGQ